MAFEITSCPFGLSGFMCSFVYLIAGGLAILAILFRKNVANDALNMPFSLIGSIAGAEAGFIITGGIISLFSPGDFNIIKFGLIAGLGGMMAGGFLLANLIGDGEGG